MNAWKTTNWPEQWALRSHWICSYIKGGLISEIFSLWLKSPNISVKSLSWALIHLSKNILKFIHWVNSLHKDLVFIKWQLQMSALASLERFGEEDRFFHFHEDRADLEWPLIRTMIWHLFGDSSQSEKNFLRLSHLY